MRDRHLGLPKKMDIGRLFQMMGQYTIDRLYCYLRSEHMPLYWLTKG